MVQYFAYVLLLKTLLLLIASREKQVASNVNWTSPPHKWRTKLFLTCFTYGTSLENGAAICKPFLLLYQGYVLIPHQTANCCLSTVYCREVSVIPNYS